MNFLIRFDIPFYTFLLFGAVSAGLSYLMYRKLEIVSTPRRIFLGSLRALSFFFLLLAMTNLVTDFVRFESKKRNMLLMVDDSKSMSLKDGASSRADVVRDILKSSSFDVLRKYFDIKPIVFGGTVLSGTGVDSLKFDRPATDIEAAIARASRMGGDGETALALLISDGDYNTGGSPVDAAGNLAFPVYTIGVGDSSAPKDVTVRQVIPAPTVYAGKKSVVRAVIGSNGFGGAYVRAQLLEDGKPVDSKGVTLPQHGSVEVSFDYTPAAVGTHVLRVYVPPLTGEFSRRNNSASARVEVRKGKYSILLVAGEPATDVAFLRRNLEAAGNFDVRVLVQKTGTSFYERNASGALSERYDAVVLYDFPNSQTSGTFREVAGVLRRTDVPYVYFAGKKYSQPLVADLPRLPFVPTGFHSGEFQAGIAMTSSEALPIALQPVYSLLDADASLFPPLYYQRILCRPSRGSVALAYPVMNGARVASPVFFANPADRSAAFLAYGVWRLQLMSSISGLRSDFLQDFLTTLMRTLISGGKQKLLSVRTGKRVYDPSQSIDFNAMLVGQSGSPVNDAAVDVNLRNAQGQTVSSVRLTSTGSGGYAGSVSGLGEGRYTFKAAASSGSTFLGSDSGMVVVEPLNTEFVQTAMNAPLLRQIAAVSGGHFMTPAQFTGNGINIPDAWKEPLKLSSSRKFELLSSLPVLALVFLLLAVEWVMRKIWGLP